jgi:hypothetical protein
MDECNCSWECCDEFASVEGRCGECSRKWDGETIIKCDYCKAKKRIPKFHICSEIRNQDHDKIIGVFSTRELAIQAVAVRSGRTEEALKNAFKYDKVAYIKGYTYLIKTVELDPKVRFDYMKFSD